MLAHYKGKFRVSQPYTFKTHNAIDMVAEDDTTLYAICDGTIGSSTIITDKSNKTWEWGNYVKLVADDGTLIFYCHMSKRLVKKGDRVKKGDPIGIEGETGYAFGRHCHLEVRNPNNKVTNEVNTVKYTGIPNVRGTYTHSFSAPSAPTPAPIPSGSTRYAKLENVPEWARSLIKELWDSGALKGDGSGRFDISDDMVRIFAALRAKKLI